MLEHKIIKLIINSMPLLLKGAFVTIQIAICAVVIGFVCGIVLGVLNSKKLRIRGFSSLIDFYVLIIRGTPLCVLVLIFYYALPDLLGINLSPFLAGALALGFNSIAYVAEIVRGGVNAIPDGQWEAGYALGYNKVSKLKHIILPQMFKNCIPTFTNEMVILFKDTSILSIIGVVEMTRIGMNINARVLQPMPIYLSIAFLYFVMTTAISFASKKLERGLNL